MKTYTYTATINDASEGISNKDVSGTVRAHSIKEAAERIKDWWSPTRLENLRMREA